VNEVTLETTDEERVRLVARATASGMGNEAIHECGVGSVERTCVREEPEWSMQHHRPDVDRFRVASGAAVCVTRMCGQDRDVECRDDPEIAAGASAGFARVAEEAYGGLASLDDASDAVFIARVM
jgi:hypothetical protein